MPHHLSAEKVQVFSLKRFITKRLHLLHLVPRLIVKHGQIHVEALVPLAEKCVSEVLQVVDPRAVQNLIREAKCVNNWLFDLLS